MALILPLTGGIGRRLFSMNGETRSSPAFVFQNPLIRVAAGMLRKTTTIMMTMVLTNLRRREEIILSFRWSPEIILLVLSTITLLKAQLETSLTKALQVGLSTLMLSKLAR